MTMHYIATVTATTTTSNLTFNSIPQTFTHLQARIWGRGTFNNAGSGLSVIMTFTGYTPIYRHRLYGNGSSALSDNFSGSFGSVGSIPDVNASANVFGVSIFDILDYTSTTKNKTLRYLGGFDNNGSGVAVIGSSVASGGAIANLDFTTDGNWVAGSRIDLYGITNNPIATGV